MIARAERAKLSGVERSALLGLGAAAVLACASAFAACGGDDVNAVQADASSDGTIGDDSGGGGGDASGGDGGGGDDGSSPGDGSTTDASDGAARDGAGDAGGDAADSGAAALCTSTGGTVTTGLCCSTQSDFPNLCTVGTCTCAPGNSKNVQKCDCGATKCFDPAVGCKIR